MLENPVYGKTNMNEKEESFDELHWFMNRKERQEKSNKSIKFGEEDIWNIQDSQSEISLDKTIELKQNIRRHDSV